jgi:hypothetical protein
MACEFTNQFVHVLNSLPAKPEHFGLFRIVSLSSSPEIQWNCMFKIVKESIQDFVQMRLVGFRGMLRDRKVRTKVF